MSTIVDLGLPAASQPATELQFGEIPRVPFLPMR